MHIKVHLDIDSVSQIVLVTSAMSRVIADNLRLQDGIMILAMQRRMLWSERRQPRAPAALCP